MPDARLRSGYDGKGDGGRQPITITNPAMTRFMMTLDDAVELVPSMKALLLKLPFMQRVARGEQALAED